MGRHQYIIIMTSLNELEFLNNKNLNLNLDMQNISNDLNIMKEKIEDIKNTNNNTENGLINEIERLNIIINDNELIDDENQILKIELDKKTNEIEDYKNQIEQLCRYLEKLNALENNSRNDIKILENKLSIHESE